MKRYLVAAVKATVAKVLRRDLVFLPLGSSNGDGRDGGSANPLLPVRYDYRASADGIITYRIQSAGTSVVYNLYSAAYTRDFLPMKGELWLSCSIPAVRSGDVLRVCLTRPGLWLNEQAIEFISGSPKPARKYIAELRLSAGGKELVRPCFHYLPYENKPIGEDYYFGDDYVNYPAEQADGVSSRVQLTRQYCLGGRLLEIGCALGLYTKGFLDGGFDAYGVDSSPFAVAEAAKRVGADRVRQCNVDQSDIPFQGLFDVMCVWDVLEHSVNPSGMIEKVSERAAPGAWLFLHTSNADSLSHRLLGRDWEGYSDYSHFGVDQVSAESLRDWLKNCGWQIVYWQCYDMWVAPVDPAIAQLRQVFMQVPELATLMAERDLGDLILVVARQK